MAVSSFDLSTSRPASTKGSFKTSARQILGNILKHLAPHVEVDGSYESNAANHASAFIARSH